MLADHPRMYYQKLLDGSSDLIKHLKSVEVLCRHYMSALVGVAMTVAGVDPIKALLYTAVVYGIISQSLLELFSHL